MLNCRFLLSSMKRSSKSWDHHKRPEEQFKRFDIFIKVGYCCLFMGGLETTSSYLFRLKATGSPRLNELYHASKGTYSCCPVFCCLICSPTDPRPWITKPSLYPRQSGHHSARPTLLIYQEPPSTIPYNWSGRSTMALLSRSVTSYLMITPREAS